MSRIEMKTLRFKSMIDAANFAADNKRVDADLKSSGKAESDNNWDLGMTLRETIGKTKRGYVWADGVAAISSAMKITDELTAKALVPMIQRKVVGSRPCVPAHVMGHPKQMYRRDRTPSVDRPVLSIGVPLGIAWFVTAQQRLNFAAAMLSAVDALETQGYRCELVALWRAAASNDDENYSRWINIEYQMKAPDQRWNPSRIAFITAHPAVQRRLTWRIAEAVPEYQNAVARSYADNSNTAVYHRSMAADFDIYFNNMGRDEARECETPKGAFEMVQAILADQLKTAASIAK